ncbi:hypothetical protein DH2020_042174 [Rehmannia glutinosa]|uniref:Large ribosomal subunit protein eL20 domain-containing protein n=1 Tax=Rehmannia glutinosa TaxID=99300 RepID=A0ABR0UN42_REHGL
MSEEGGDKSRGDLEAAGDHSSRPPPNYYGTFQGVANYQPQAPPPSHSVMGFPQPVPPPGYSGSAPHYYHQGYQTVPGYAVFHQYQVVGRALPTETDEHPKIYRMKLWATNEVRAKSKFWYFLRKLKKVKKSNGQVLAINEIFEKNPTTIKNYGIWLRYQSRTGYHNMYKEYRDTTLNGAVEQMYTEMASRHRVRHHCIQIIKTATIPAKLCKRESTKQFHDSKIKFPLVFRKVRPPSRKLKTTYKATRPNLFM